MIVSYPKMSRTRDWALAVKRISETVGGRVYTFWAIVQGGPVVDDATLQYLFRVRLGAWDFAHHKREGIYSAENLAKYGLGWPTDRISIGMVILDADLLLRTVAQLHGAPMPPSVHTDKPGVERWFRDFWAVQIAKLLLESDE